MNETTNNETTNNETTNNETTNNETTNNETTNNETTKSKEIEHLNEQSQNENANNEMTPEKKAVARGTRPLITRPKTEKKSGRSGDKTPDNNTPDKKSMLGTLIQICNIVMPVKNNLATYGTKGFTINNNGKGAFYSEKEKLEKIKQ